MIAELLAIAISSFIIGLSGAMSPGPVLTITIAESIKRGPWVGPLITLGHALLELILVIAIILGLGSLLTRNNIQIVLFGFGSILLALMAYLTWRSSKGNLTEALNTDSSLASGHFLRLPLIGIYISLSNPFWTIWWATIGMLYLGVAIKYKWLGVAAFFIGHIISDFFWYTIVSFSVGKGRKFISPRWYRYVLIACSVVLFAFAGFFLFMSVKKALL